MSQLKITYRKSTIGYSHDQKRTVQSLGLRKLGQSVLLPDNDAVRGMCFKVRHLVTMEEVQDGEVGEATAGARSKTYEAA